MKFIQHIFAATDLSDYALRVVDRGFQLARTAGARYTVMHALGLDALGPLRNLIGEQAEEVTHKVRERQHAALQAITADPARHQGVTPGLLVEEGLAAVVVPSQAAACQADLVVVGAKGEHPVQRWLIGSTASHLLRKSPAPVLVVKQPCQGAYVRALVAVDFSPVSLRLIRVLRELAPQAHIVLLHVFDVPFEGMLQYAGVAQQEIQRYREEAGTRALHDLHRLALQAGLAPADYVAVVENGHAAGHILNQETLSNCDLVVMGKHGSHVTEELLLGSVTRRVLAQTRADVLVVVDQRGPAVAEEVPGAAS